MKKMILNCLIKGLFFCTFFIIIFGCNEDDNNGNEPNNQDPTCIITSPNEGAEITKGTSVTIGVDAEDTDGNINEVKFYIDEIGVGTANSFPYNYTWNTSDEITGNHKIKAIAHDNDSGSKTDEISVTIIEELGDTPLAAFIANTTSVKLNVL